MDTVDYNLRPLWDKLLDLYERFDAFCKEQKLRYYVTGGTLLGAVRHNGFIPWDDDLDVVMPRPDYVRYLSLGAEVSGTHLVKPGDEGWSHLFAKVVDTACPSAWIDVIPIDGMPRATIPFYFWAFKRSTWRHRNQRSLFWNLAAILLNCSGTDEDFEHWLESYPYDSSPCVEDYNANGRRFKLRALSADSFGTPIMHKFDRVEVPMPREWAKFLECIFGPNYMSLPPEDKRHPSHDANQMVKI